jgi:hypothetical protein
MNENEEFRTLQGVVYGAIIGAWCWMIVLAILIAL